MNAVLAMLDHCAPGWQRVETDHHWRITYATLTYPAFPKGEHGARKNPDVQVGHVRKLVRHFKIEECARTQIDLG